MIRKKDCYIKKIKYICPKIITKSKDVKKSVKVIGLDTETTITGRCFIICTSTGDVYTLNDIPGCFFQRKYRGYSFVCYNLKFDQGALLQRFPENVLQTLWSEGKAIYNCYTVKSIANKCLIFSKGHKSVTFYDMYNFFGGSLDYNAQKYLNEKKTYIETKDFHERYVIRNISKIIEYCIQDAILVQKLAELIISRFEFFGVYPKKLYSTAYVSFQYFRAKTFYVTVKRFWDNYRKLLNYAMQSYNGGKFEVTEKGTGYYYEYDIVSAYPYEIANLVDITYCRVVESKKYRRQAVYGFLKCRIKIPVNIFSPIAIQKKNVNIFPCGYIEKVITKKEYEYFVSQNVDIEIIDGIWLHIDRRTYPYRKEIKKLIQYKHRYKQENKLLEYHTIKIFLNSLYGKMVQLIPMKDYYKAGVSWNPIYASVITSNTRIRVTEMQQKYKSVIAVHTDSIISKKKLNIETGKELGNYDFECEGNGLILGSGIYQVGSKNRFRGFDIKVSLCDLFNEDTKLIDIEHRRPYTWREVVFRHMNIEKINRFFSECKKVSVDFDKKRIWLNDYKNFKEIFRRNVESLPHYNTDIL